jgi:hypothetical protein
MNKSILLVSSPRTGSTAYGSMLGKKYNINFYSEPFMIESQFNLDSKILEEKIPYIIKLHARDFEKHRKVNFIELDNFYTIRIRRKNLVDQVASMYVAEIRNKWHYNSESEIKKFIGQVVPLNYQMISRMTRITQMSNLILDHFDKIYNFRFDEEVYYEDLTFIETLKTVPPVNYEELKDLIRDIIV